MNMMIKSIAACAITLASFSTLAAQEINREQADSYQKIGMITSSNTDSPMDAARELSQTADALGGKYFFIVSMDNDDLVRSSAIVYK
ncbi:YdgH/BhsA/McbA-like domain containing protein [Dickeya dadantii subsp. dieffenbachiae]|uniref:YdgH/BhsA/McbA-like domain containing protein n=1 Tax=Dickeya dadantii TaxID=204038 RepID=UPI0003A80928|nr:YdgH/BhsA/McbA-like domain containing protein [Dickeya dadantii]